MTNFRPGAFVRGLTLALLACSLQASCAKTPPDPPRFTIDIFERAFRGEALESAEGGIVTTRVEEIGRLEIASGRIVAVEPFMAFAASPLSIEVPPGEYPVQVSLRRDSVDERVAFARIVFASAAPIYWEPAIPSDFDLSKVTDDRLPAYSVDGGLGSFMDSSTAKHLATLNEGQGFFAELDRHFDDEQPLRIMLAAGDGNVAVFATGIGDGSYASFFGFDRQGRVVQLVTNFGLIKWEPGKYVVTGR